MFHGPELLRSYAENAVRNSRQLNSKANVFATIIAEAEKGETEQLTDLDQARSWRLHRWGLRYDRHHLGLPNFGNPEASRTATRRRRRSRKVTRERNGRYPRTVPSLKRLHRGDVANLRSRTRGFAAESTSWRCNARRL